MLTSRVGRIGILLVMLIVWVLTWVLVLILWVLAIRVLTRVLVWSLCWVGVWVLWAVVRLCCVDSSSFRCANVRGNAIFTKFAIRIAKSFTLFSVQQISRTAAAFCTRAVTVYTATTRQRLL